MDVNIIDFLLTVGYVTVPAHAARFSINSLWAWVRYFGALSRQDDFRLSKDFSEIDAHQKTILSDDFGVGVSLDVLFKALDIVDFCDGRYFIDRMAANAQIEIAATGAKKGPNKSPDFIMRDANGRFHVVECKGSQSGRNYVRKQLRDAIPQKRSIVFHGDLRGQSLATGLVISNSEADYLSELIITDPISEDPILSIDERDDENAQESVARGKLSRALKLAGAVNLSRSVAAPLGDSPAAFRRSDVSSNQAFHAARQREEGKEEILRLARFGSFVGREAKIDLPFAIETNDGTFTSVLVRYGVSRDVILEWSERISSATVDFGMMPKSSVQRSRGKVKTESDKRSGLLRDGPLFESTIELLK